MEGTEERKGCNLLIYRSLIRNVSFQLFKQEKVFVFFHGLMSNTPEVL